MFSHLGAETTVYELVEVLRQCRVGDDRRIVTKHVYMRI